MNHAEAKAPSRVRGLLQTGAVIAVLLLGIVALNWPITFATATSTPVATQGVETRNQTTEDSEQSAADVAEQANPAVVTITNYQTQSNPFTGEPESGEAIPYGVGSGYIIDTDGHVVTNWHVVAGGTAFEVQFLDGSTAEATLVGSDRFQDVAVLKLEVEAGQEVPGVLSFADSDTARAGDQVIAIGSPYGEFTNSVSEGTISAVGRALDTGDGYAMPNLIQHSAPIYEGNSGGPLLNMDGQVVGMNVAKATQSQLGISRDDQSGIGFAIASDAVKSLVDQIISTGKVSRAYLGIESRTLQSGQGVVSVETGSPAATAGLEAGDIITGFDGQEIDANHPFINMLIFDHKPGDTVSLDVDRNGQEITLEVTLGERPAEMK
jgi:S1-C subfamily serine protease